MAYFLLLIVVVVSRALVGGDKANSVVKLYVMFLYADVHLIQG